MGVRWDVDAKNKLSSVLDSFSKDDLSDAFICSNVRNPFLGFFLGVQRPFAGPCLV